MLDHRQLYFCFLRDSILFSTVAASTDFGSELTRLPLQLTPMRVQSCHLPVIILVPPSTKVRLYVRTITPFSGIWERVGLKCWNTYMIECDLCVKLEGDFLEKIGNILFAPLKTEVLGSQLSFCLPSLPARLLITKFHALSVVGKDLESSRQTYCADCS